MKQDYSGVRTAQDLERKYNFSSMQTAIQQSEQGITKISSELDNFVSATVDTLDNLQNQIDGNITTYYYSGVPTLSNLPASEWSSTEYNVHLGDLYYDKDTGNAYRFYLDSDNNTYGWFKLTDSDVTQALALANAAKDTADSKRRVFLAQPTPPYDNGDLWINNQEIFICQISKGSSETFSPNDFINNLKYTDDTKATQIGGQLNIVSGRVTTVEQGIDELSAQMEENRYYEDETGNRILITEKIGRIVANVDNISQEIHDNENLVRQVTGEGRIMIQNALAGSIQYLQIIGQLELIYPNNDLYPSNDIYPLGTHLIVESIPENNEEIQKKEYILPINKLNLGERLEIDFNGKCTLIKTNGTIEDLGTINIELFEGNNYIYVDSQNLQLLNYNASYIIKSPYTKLFATRVEMNSKIAQKVNEINLEVNEKIDKNEIIAKLNVAIEDEQGIINITGNQVTIDSDNFKLESDGSLTCNNGTFNGTINTGSGTIGGFSINETNLYANIQDKYTYTNEDYIELRNILANSIPPTDEQLEKYDVDHNGILDSYDLMILQWKLTGYASSQGSFLISTDDANNSIVFKGNANEPFKTSMGISRITTNWMTATLFRAISEYDITKETIITGDGISTPSITQTSLAGKKKNFVKLENVKEIIKSVDIYKYNFKDEMPNEKKSIGFVIGEGFKYSEEITSKNNDGVNIYSMVSVLWQAVKEQQDMIEKLETRIKELESDKK